MENPALMIFGTFIFICIVDTLAQALVSFFHFLTIAKYKKAIKEERRKKKKI